MSHIGIQLRVSIPAGPLIEANSDMLHYMAQMSRYGVPVEFCTPNCLPECMKHGWMKLINPDVFTGTDITVEIKPVNLPDSYPED